MPAGIVGEAGQDGVHPPGRDRRHELGKAGLLPFDLDAELAADGLAEIDVEAGQRVGGGIAELHRRIVRHQRDLDAAALGDLRRQLDRHDRSAHGANECRRNQNSLHRYVPIQITAERNALVRSSRGAPKTSDARPCSMIAPWSM